MTNAEKVANFLRGSKPHRFCGQSVADAVQLGSRSFGQSRQHYNPHIAQQNGTALGQTRQFRRASGVCHQCGALRKVTWAK